MVEARSADEENEGVAEIAAALSGAPARAIVRVGGGRNSRVYRVETPAGVFALKQYPSLADDPRDRLGTEMAALQWMEQYGIGVVPRFVAADRERNFALLSWADGELVRDPGESDVDQALSFLASLHDLRDTPALGHDRLAAEACLSGSEIERQVRARIAHLRALDEPELAGFLDGELVPGLDSWLDQAKATLVGAGLSFDAELPQNRRSLVPSDFGFHNALRDASGRLTFIDFEYFGWDDPVKLTADILLHPGTPVSAGLRDRFRRGAEALYGTDPDFVARLAAFFPLFGLRWTLILLNEFHPERWRRRLLAGATDDWAEAKQRQLRAARAMLGGLASQRR